VTGTPGIASSGSGRASLRPGAGPAGAGLAGLRRRAEVTELLFLFECTTAPPTRLRPIADRLGVTVQAASHAYRTLARRGLVESRDGRYRPTVAGVDWLHSRLGDLQDDLAERLRRLRVVRSGRAVAGVALRAGEVVSLAVEHGLLTARPGSKGASTGRARSSARPGTIVEVLELNGIVPLDRGKIDVYVVDPQRVNDPRLLVRIRQQVRGRSEEVLAAVGLEAYHLARRATSRPILRFGVGAAAREASRLGISTSVFVSAPELPRLLADLGEADDPPLTVQSLLPGAAGRERGRSGPRAGRRRSL
jgi:putative transcriptional regulator